MEMTIPLVNPDRVAGGIAARKLMDEAIRQASDHPADEFYDRFWEVIRDAGIARLGLPRDKSDCVPRMSNTRAEAFAKRRIPKVYGEERSRLTVGKMEVSNREWLEFAADNPNPFERELREYLARDDGKAF